MFDGTSNSLSMLLPLLMMKEWNHSFFLILVIQIAIWFHRNYDEQIRSCWPFFRKKHQEYKVNCYISYKDNALHSFSASPVYSAIMKELYNSVITSDTAYYIKEEHSSSWRMMKIVLFHRPDTEYKLTPNVYVKHSYTHRESKKENGSYYTYTLTLRPIDNDFKGLMEYVKKTVEKYDQEQMDGYNERNVFILTGFDSHDNPNFNQVSFNTTKNFDNLFFEKKDELIQRLDYFSQNEAEYKRLGMPYTFGMMFHGEPGTGKTSTIKAVAKHTDRNVIILPVKKIKTVDQLKEVFFSNRINGLLIPMDKRLYVFEDIDCSEWASIVCNRQIDTFEPLIQTDLLLNKIIEKIDENTQTTVPNNKSKCELSLGDLLEVLDGIVEMPGRMIILTTNHPEKIDPALLRPGRIDMNIEFKRLRVVDVEAMYRLWFGKPMPKEICNQDYTFTQAEIGNLFALKDQA
jgi:ATP-dependent Zn protease